MGAALGAVRGKRLRGRPQRWLEPRYGGQASKPASQQASILPVATLRASPAGAGRGAPPPQPLEDPRSGGLRGRGVAPRPPVAAQPDGVAARTVMVAVRVTGTELATGRAEAGRREACYDRRMWALVAIPACPVHFGGRRTPHHRSGGPGPGRPCRWRACDCATSSGAPMPIRAPRTWLGVTPDRGMSRSASGRMEPDSPSSTPLRGHSQPAVPSRKGVERRFQAAEDPFADQLAAGLFGIAAQGRDAVVAGGSRAVRLRTRFRGRPRDLSGAQIVQSITRGIE